MGENEPKEVPKIENRSDMEGQIIESELIDIDMIKSLKGKVVDVKFGHSKYNDVTIHLLTDNVTIELHSNMGVIAAGDIALIKKIIIKS